MKIIRDYSVFFKNICHFKPELKNLFVFNIVLALIFVVVTLSVPYALKITVDTLASLNASTSGAFVLGITFIYGLMWTANQLLQWIRTLISAPFIAKCDSTSQLLLYLHLIEVKYEKIRTLDLGHLYAVLLRCRSAFSTLSFAFLWILTPVFMQIVLGCILLFLTIGPLMGSVVLISLVILLVSSVYFASRTTHSHNLSFDAQNLMATHFNEKLSSVLEIKTNSAYNKEFATMSKVGELYSEKVISSANKLAYILISQSSISGFIFTVIHMAGAYNVFRGGMTLGDFVLMSGYVLSLMTPFDALAAAFSDLRKHHIALNEGMAILEMEKEDGGEITCIFDGIPLQVIAYESPHTPVKINIVVETGQCLIISGESGKGKTTFVHSILGLNKDYTGDILLYGRDLRQLSPFTISQYVAFVQQAPTLFTGTVRDNLLYGTDKELNDNDLASILSGMRLLNLGHGDPLGYSIGVKGDKLSGGERKRIAIARAVVRDLPILILDEPTAGLDAETEEHVMHYLKSLNKTMIIVSHNPGTVRHATVIHSVA